MKEKELKYFLGNRKSEEIEWAEKKHIVISMLVHIGSPDSQLRDNMIYQTFCQLILETKIDDQLLGEILELCLSDQFLFKGIGEKDTDSVFTRSFTSLLIALILYQDNRNDFLTEAKVNEIKDKLISYVNLEKDVRGYVKDKGWAHSMAHVADAFDELVKSEKINQSTYPAIMQAIWQKIYQTETVYIHDEDERMIVPIIQMIDNGLGQEVLEGLIINMKNDLHQYRNQIEEESYWFLVANCKNFLKSLLVHMISNPKLSSMQSVVSKTLNEMYEI
ncbi:DUF2785 domain-containing protein [Niallia sp.]|uniref:DUF2785 domain-containing protein n=1 Tax=Niallia sp. TaxID=2837523 RepID=UPI0028A0B3CA|nr:DUF2785 domain-containing protein [Niallia sp.]